MTTEAGAGSYIYSAIFDVAPYSNLLFFLNVQSVVGTSPTLALTIEDSMNGTDWTTAGTAGATATGVQKLSVTYTARFIRARYEITGTDAGLTFSLLALAREF